MLDTLIDAFPKIVLLSTMIAPVLPSPKGHGPLSKLHKAINLLAFNFGYAANRT